MLRINILKLKRVCVWTTIEYKREVICIKIVWLWWGAGGGAASKIYIQYINPTIRGHVTLLLLGVNAQGRKGI